MKTTLEQWRMLQAVVQYGSFGKAAEAIHKSQSSINTAVHKLQESLGVQLLRTQGRRTVLTEAGELMLRRGNLLLDEVRRLEEVAQHLSRGTEPSVRVAVDSIYPNHNLYQAFDSLSTHFPHTRVELIETVLSGSNELLQSGQVPIAISPAPLPGYAWEAICQVVFVAVAANSHPLIRQGGSLSHDDLKAYRQIVTRDSGQTSKTDSGWLAAEQRWTVSNMSTSIELVRQGFGYAWLPQLKISGELASGQLQPLPLAKGQSRQVSLYLIIDDEDKLGPAAREFVATIRQFAQ